MVELTAIEEQLCEQSRWDFSDLRALFINCTLKRSPEVSNTQALADRSIRRPRPVNALTDPHQLADSDPASTGGDALRIRRLARAITPPIAHPTLRIVDSVPGPLAGALRTGLDILFTLTPKGRPA